MRPLLVVALLAACGSPVKRQLVTLQEEGAFVEAAQRAMDAIDADPDQAFAWSILEDVRRDAFVSQLELARELEARGRLEQSRDAYLTLTAYLQRLRQFEDFDFPTDGLDELDDVENELAAAWFAQGKADAEARRQASAEHHFVAAAELRPGAHPTDEARAENFSAWARDDLERKRWLDAIAHFDARAELDGSTEAISWAATLRTAIGDDALARGACRVAVEHFRAAQLPDDRLERARACARREVVIHPVRTGSPIPAAAGTDVARLLADRLGKRLRENRSEFVALLNRDQLAETPPDEATRRVALRGDITQLTFQLDEDVTATRGAAGHIKVPCSDLSGDDGLALCEDPVSVSYTEHLQKQAFRLAARIAIVETRTGEELGVYDHVILQSSETRWADAFRDDSGTALQVTSEATRTAVGVPADIAELARTPGVLPPRADLLRDGIEELATHLAASILAELDQPDVYSPPTALRYEVPLVHAEQITFGSADIRVETLQPDAPSIAELPAPDLAGAQPLGMLEPWLSLGLPLGAGQVTNSRPLVLSVQYGPMEPIRLTRYFSEWFAQSGWTEKLSMAASDTHTALLTREGVDLTITSVPLERNTLVMLTLSREP